MRPISHRFASCLTLLVLSLAATMTALADDVRTWTSGKATLKAKFVSVEDGKVTLAKEDGDEVEIDLKKLSAADQKYVADRNKADADPFQAKPKAKDPFQAKMKKAAGAGAAKGESGEARTIKPNWSAARAVVLAPATNDWNVAVAPVADPGAGVKPRPIGVAPKTNFFEGTKGLVVSGDGKRAALAYALDDPKPDGTTRVVVSDLEKGQPFGAASTSGKMAPLALNNDGSQILMRRDEFFPGTKDRLELWTLDDSGIRKGLSFCPHDDAQNGDRDVNWAAFLDAGRIITASGGGKLAAWDLEKGKPLYLLAGLAGGSTPALSPDRKLLAFATDKELGVLDVEAGSVVALQGRPQSPWPALAFSPSGRKIALVGIDKLWVWDTATGALDREMLLTGIHVGGKVQFTGEDYVLVGGQYLLDLPNQVKLWQYEPPPGNEAVAASLGSLCLFYAANGTDHPGTLLAAQLPHAGAKAALTRAIADPTFFVLKPGGSVKIDATGLADPAQGAKVVEALTAKLAALNIQVAANAPITLVASTETGKVQDRTYHTFGRGDRTYKVQDYFTHLKFVYQGKTAWENTGSSIPGMVMLKEGQTMEAYLKDHERPNYDFFSHVELPKLLTKPTGSPTLGKSSVSSAGIR